MAVLFVHSKKHSVDGECRTRVFVEEQAGKFSVDGIFHSNESFEQIPGPLEILVEAETNGFMAIDKAGNIVKTKAGAALRTFSDFEGLNTELDAPESLMILPTPAKKINTG